MLTKAKIFHSTGNDSFKEVVIQPRVYVGSVTCKTLEEAVRYSQNDLGYTTNWNGRGARNTQIGDLILFKGEFYMMVGIGFKRLLSYAETKGTCLIIKKSPQTGKLNLRLINITTQQMEAFIVKGTPLTQMCPEMSADDREFLMTGFTPEDWDVVTKEAQ